LIFEIGREFFMITRNEILMRIDLKFVGKGKSDEMNLSIKESKKDKVDVVN